MVKISILYPDTGRFDKDYYLDIHMPLSIEKQGDALKGISVEIGLNGGNAEVKPPCVAMCHLLYDSIEAFRTAFLPHAELLTADMINYTDIQPVYQISEVKIYK
ncbi:MAG TPA: EthD family reductase [Puia sp.]|nr:EthD family reductase [Puia sp.]